MKKWILLLFCLTLTGCTHQTSPDFPESPANSVETPDVSATVSPLKGEALSPNGRYEVRLQGHSEGVTSAGLYPSGHVQIVDISTGEVKWQASGGYTVGARWSPDSSYVAISTAARTWESITIVETETFAQWEVTRPDESRFPDHTYLESMSWEIDPDPNVVLPGLRFTWDHGDGTGLQEYRSRAHMEDGILTGWTDAITRETLPGEYDFDHDGVTETVMVEGQNSDRWLLQVLEGEDLLWFDQAFSAHVGWNSIFAYKEDGKDYLLRYHPTTYQGHSSYTYTIFSLGQEGEEILLREPACVSFDAWWNHPGHQFDAAAVAAFMEAVNADLANSRLLLSTDDQFQHVDPEHPQHLWWEKEAYLYDESKTLEENLRAMDAQFRVSLPG